MFLGNTRVFHTSLSQFRNGIIQKSIRAVSASASPSVGGKAETESHTTDSPSPQSSILDAPLPPTLVRIQQSNAVRYLT